MAREERAEKMNADWALGSSEVCQDRYVRSRSNECSSRMSPLLRSRLYLRGIEGSLSQLRSAACQLRLSATSRTETNIITDDRQVGIFGHYYNF